MAKSLAVFFFFFAIAPFALAKTNRLRSTNLHVKTGIRPLGAEFNLTDRNESNPIHFKPNLNNQFFVSATLEGLIGVSWGFKTPNNEGDQLKRGETTYSDWRFTFPFEQFRIDAYWVQYKGFYIENSADVDPSWDSTGPYVHDSNLQNRSAGIRFTWVHDPKSFSLVSAIDQTDLQKSSGGSWLYGMSVVEDFYTSESEIIPSAVQSRYGEDATLKSGKFQSLIVHGGYGYTLVPFDHWSITLAAQLGLGPQNVAIVGTGFNETQSRTARLVDAFANVGYNGPTFFSGAQFQSNQVVSESRSLKLSNGLFEIAFYLGAHL
tara:strand:+ start:119 stop:1078 length:960 start_codon:yes stop_codon:yes gene_type:complete